MDEMTINGIKYIPQAKKIAVDTGTSSVSGPTMDVSKINFMIEEKCNIFKSGLSNNKVNVAF